LITGRSTVNGFRSLWARHRRWGSSALVAIAGPALVTLLAPIEDKIPTTTPALLYVLVVALASGVGGPVAGVAASMLSFLLLNFFFTPPLHTFTVNKPEDLVALVVFLVVSVITGLLLSAALTQKSRAERREIEARLLNQFTSRLLSDQPLEAVLDDFAADLVKVFRLASCEITTVMTDPVKHVEDPDGLSGEPYQFDLSSSLGSIGKMQVHAAESRGRLDHDELAVLKGFARQLALALESVRLSREVKDAQFEAESNRLRAALFSSVTHDLKTPLSAITASVTSLLDGAGFTVRERHEHLETIQQEAEHLNRVVSNLLDLSRLRAGALTPSKAFSPVDELIEAVIGRLRPMLRGREVTMNIRNDLLDVSMDIVQIDQVLTNLIENAVKFSPKGSPIDISAVGSSRTVRVTVADKGPGIPKGERNRVFEPFERGEGGTGTGLGLAIAKAVIIAHGGRIWASEVPGGGAAVTFELPIDPENVGEVESGSRRTDR
jgi:two-component system sensor histidine kinase KdpD